ncbi:MAG: hypothetical protein HN778_15190 [Prolixibacteraceae bacterium]|jgi:hypothetical protein|nr:hypothetical protein [Prolixibacteraceae bacterium]MBT6762987.1 hypothetical protein [Prolixibacteraceae bacterium]MBT6997488.1 hypothetical protein [Prolixibacteraceae bacterium]MBT7396174.1 hypothetical protein [Prolixibacteraceae bacterium]
MNKLNFILIFITLFSHKIYGQNIEPTEQTQLQFKGQFSSVAHFNGDNELPLWLGGRYLPQLNYSIELPTNRLIDFEYSANFFGNAGLKPFSESDLSGKIKNYRAWARYSSKQFEIRAGLQKINFGSASILRPLMWFDQLDPRDPLRLTDGVWGVLTRYYFLNNANLWVWGLYGNKNPKGWEFAETTKNKPELGGRFQTPVPKGEAAISFHHRKATTFDLDENIPPFNEIPENRIGFDARFDMVVGWWVEGSWISNKADLDMFTNQQILNIGADYTFGIGNGIYVIYEQLFASYGEKAFSFKNTTSFSLLNLSYPIGMFDNLSAIVYYDWTNNKSYNFINWQKQFDKISLFFMGYWNPEVFQIPTQTTDQNLYGGKGIQVMFVFNH